MEIVLSFGLPENSQFLDIRYAKVVMSHIGITSQRRTKSSPKFLLRLQPTHHTRLNNFCRRQWSTQFDGKGFFLVMSVPTMCGARVVVGGRSWSRQRQRVQDRFSSVGSALVRVTEESRRGAVFVFGRDTAAASHDCCCATSNTMSTFGTRVLVSLMPLPKSTVFFHFVASRAILRR